ncbi:putative murein hydrolase (TIGR00659 family) [Altererythrobacter atlanticus]|uniref:Inner membrane protein YohK n=1 Tax=Croceibacterium atlanticum TaxID=1267766 RepID=A0A0F7KQZ0_9SPHN|nr:LrgB family protein [Croceibacterium atlanticum]AKH41989.1 Inner membrane protein YohK [Croceibacterium atlanticum]MBB5733443.1 putative murein hydrolase (TIGR00659 family) [Croceibacterium atlanticum]
MSELASILQSQLLWLAVTLVVFDMAERISRRSKRHPLCHPVLLSVPVLIGILLATDTPYPVYLSGTGFLGFLLGPAVVGLAVPIWHQRALIRRLALPITLSLLGGSITAIVSAVGILSLFGAPQEILASIAPRASTTPVAMAMADQLGGIPALAAVIVLIAGVSGGVTVTPLFNAMGITDYRARGFAVGVSSHGFGAARAFQVDPTAGAFASLGMALNALATASLLSILALLL